jgi:nucleoside-triphosphatase THEP1
MLEPGFKSSLQRINEAKEKGRHEFLSHTTLSFGNSFLNEAIGGITKNDLCIFTAASGVGKTDIVSNIAYKNAKAGKRVRGIFLEAYDREIEDRQSFRVLASMAKSVRDQRTPIYDEWLAGKQDWLSQYQPDVSYFDRVETKYRQKSYTLDDLKRDVLSSEGKTDLIVIDHLGYFDIEGKNENQEITEIVKVCSDMINIVKIPIILVAHVRKLGPNKIMPDMEDIQGTSNIYKIATKVVSFASLGPVGDNKYSTLVRVVKNRRKSSVRHYVARMYYDESLNDYVRTYDVGKIEFDPRTGRESFVELTNNKPRWFKGGKDDQEAGT